MRKACCAAVAGLIVAALGCSWTLLAQQEPAAPILAAMRRADPAIQHVDVTASVPAAGGITLELVIGSAKADRAPRTDGAFDWLAGESLSLLSDNPTGNPVIRVVKSYRHNTSMCCALRVLRATPAEFVVSRSGLEGAILPNLKLWFDSNAGTATSAEYTPFSIQAMRIDSGVPNFTAGDGRQFFTIRATSAVPFLQLMPGRADAPTRSATSVPTALFGPRAPSLPQSTYQEFSEARTALVAPGVRSEPVKIRETIGPIQVVGTRVWLGKTFQDAEGYSGVGAFGYLDQNEGKFHLFSPPEIRDWSVSAILIEDQTAWLGLVSHRESYDAAGGVLRIDMQTMQVRKYDSDGVASDFARFEDRLYLATSTGIGVVTKDGSIQHVFLDQAADRTYRLNSY
ncbi:MAG TPA: hypothetical protein VK210_07870 [Terriglobia bacterium]|nr:hypothetical protein [Terriglobia bacterium]